MLGRLAATAVTGAALGAIGCKDSDEAVREARAAAAAAEAAACGGAERHGGSLHWFRDDYPRALGCARAKRVPVVIDMWAPWCHTCLSMQAFVLTAPELASYDRRFVFLALDTDKDANAAAVAKFPPAAWPTFFIVEPADEALQARFVGSASIEQFAGFLDAHAGADRSDAGLAPSDRLARDGDRAAARKDWAAAEVAYRAALAPASPWVRRPDVLVSLLQVVTRQKKWADCAALATAHIGATGSAASASDFTSYVLKCATGLAKTDPATATGLREAVVHRLSALTADAAAPLSDDDRSDALVYLREALDALGRPDDARAAAARQRALLDAAAARAPDALVASTYNWPRAEVYTYLGAGLELVGALEASAAALPDEYDPPYRLGWVYWKAGQLDVARQWVERSLALVYGPRKTRALAMLADIEKARGDVVAEKRAREEIVATWESLPAAAQSPEAIARARADLAALDAPAPAPPPPAPPAP